MSRFARHAFTLIELLVVISIIALLISILLPALSRARASAQTAVCLSHLRTVGTSLYVYASDYKDYGLSPYPHLVTPNARNERLWPDTLMRHRYLPNVMKERNGDSILTYISAVPAKNVFSCPVLEPPVTHTYSGWTFPRSGTSASSYLSYGIRELRINPSDSTMPYAYPKEIYDPTYRLPRLSTLYGKGPFMGDTWTRLGSGEAIQTASFSYAQSPVTPTGEIHLRHSGAANLWFPGGSVKSMSKSAISSLPNTLNAPGTMIYSYP